MVSVSVVVDVLVVAAAVAAVVACVALAGWLLAVTLHHGGPVAMAACGVCITVVVTSLPFLKGPW